MLIITFILVQSCSQTRRLQDGQKILVSKYRNIDKFDNTIFKLIDKDYFYVETDYYACDKNFKKKIRDFGSYTTRNMQFYDNGRIRIFGHKKPDPEITGRRGIAYINKKEIFLDTQGASQDGDIFKMTYKIKVDGDKIFMREASYTLFGTSEKSCYVYQKSEKVPENLKQYKADW